jgi:hypothetical protein
MKRFVLILSFVGAVALALTATSAFAKGDLTVGT